MSLNSSLIREQERIREQLLLHDMITFNADTLGNLKYVAGVDLSFPLDDFENAIACLVVMEFPSLEVFSHHHLIRYIGKFNSLMLR